MVGELPDPPGRERAGEDAAYVLEHLPADPRLSLLLAVDRRDLFTEGITSATAIGFGRTMLHRFPVQWAALGFQETDLGELAEFLLRIVQSLIIDPGRPRRSAQELTRYPNRWIAPALSHRTPGAPQSET